MRALVHSNHARRTCDLGLTAGGGGGGFDLPAPPPRPWRPVVNAPAC